MWAMMQKFRICAGAVKVLSAKLLMGISWSDGPYRLPGYRAEPLPTQSRRGTVPYARKHGVAVEDVPALRGESGVQRGAQVHPQHPAVRNAAAEHPGRDQGRTRRTHRFRQ